MAKKSKLLTEIAEIMKETAEPKYFAKVVTQYSKNSLTFLWTEFKKYKT